MALRYPSRYTRGYFPLGATGFLYIPRVGAIVDGEVDAYGWQPPYFDSNGLPIYEDLLNPGSLPESGNKAVPALVDDDRTTRRLYLKGANWKMKRTPPDDFANLDWRGHAGTPGGKLEVLQWWGPPNRYWHAADNGDYPPYTDRIYRRGGLFLQAPGPVAGCALHKEPDPGAVIAVAMSPVGLSYSDFTVTSAGSGSYDEESSPVELGTVGAINEDITITFTDSANFNIVGSVSGNLGSGNTSSDTAPTNSEAGEPYWTLRSAGFSGAWQAGDMMTFTTRSGSYANGNITQDRLYARVVRGRQSLQNKKETGIFKQAEFDELIALFNSATLASKAIIAEAIIQYSQRWHEIDLTDHPNLVDETVPGSENAGDETRSEAELFPWHFSGSGTECQTLRRMTAHLDHASGYSWDLKAYRYDRLKLAIDYQTSELEVQGQSFVVTLIDPVVTAQRIQNQRVPMWAATDTHIDDDEVYPIPAPVTVSEFQAGLDEYGVDIGDPLPFTGYDGLGNPTYDASAAFASAADFGTFSYNLGPFGDSRGETIARAQAGHLSAATGWMHPIPSHNLHQRTDVDDQRSQSEIVVAVDYDEDTELLGKVDWTESLDTEHDYKDLDLSVRWVEWRIQIFSAEVQPIDPGDPEAGGKVPRYHYLEVTFDTDPTVLDPAAEEGEIHDMTVDYDLTVTLSLPGGATVKLHDEQVDTVWMKERSSDVPGHPNSENFSHGVAKTTRTIDHLDLRRDMLIYTEQQTDVEQASPELGAVVAGSSIVSMSTPGGVSGNYYPMELDPDTGEGRVADETFTERVVLWHDGETETLVERSFTPQGRAAVSFNDYLQLTSDMHVTHRCWMPTHETLTDPFKRLIGRLLGETGNATDSYISGELESHAMPVTWSARLGGWAVDESAHVMASMSLTLNPSAMQYTSPGYTEVYDPDEALVVNYLGEPGAGAEDLVALNELTVPPGEHAAFYNCAFVGV